MTEACTDQETIEQLRQLLWDLWRDGYLELLDITRYSPEIAEQMQQAADGFRRG